MVLNILVILFVLCIIYLIWNIDFKLDKLFEEYKKDDELWYTDREEWIKQYRNKKDIK